MEPAFWLSVRDASGGSGVVVERERVTLRGARTLPAAQCKTGA
jgi:hypothetical protein